MVFATKVMNLKTLLFSKYKYTILTPSTEILDENSFSNYRMGKYCLLKTPLKILVWIWNAEMSVLKWRNGEWRMEMFMKNAHDIFVL